MFGSMRTIILLLMLLPMLLLAFAPAEEAVQVTPQLIVGILAGILALVLDVVPGLKQKWAGLPQELKRLGWLAGCLIVPFVPLFLRCAGINIGFLVSCDAYGVREAAQTAFAAYYLSQSVHGLYVGVGKLIIRRSPDQPTTW